jgi:ribosomal protein S18 acetylase RimI-like enzyme
MNIIKVDTLDYAEFIAKSQVTMALETEDYVLDYETVKLGVHAVINDKQKGSYYIALIDNKPVACLLTVNEWSDWRNKTVLWIHSVYVEQDHRRKSIYKDMYTYLKNIVQENDEYAGIRLYVDKTNQNASQVYLKLGMESEHYHLFEWLK